jgi:hypothetical protein
MPPLHLCAHAMNDSVTEMREAAQTFGDRAQKRIAILHRERVRGGEYDVQLAIGQLKHCRSSISSSCSEARRDRRVDRPQIPRLADQRVMTVQNNQDAPKAMIVRAMVSSTLMLVIITRHQMLMIFFSIGEPQPLG